MCETALHGVACSCCARSVRLKATSGREVEWWSDGVMECGSAAVLEGLSGQCCCCCLLGWCDKSVAAVYRCVVCCVHLASVRRLIDGGMTAVVCIVWYGTWMHVCAWPRI